MAKTYISIPDAAKQKGISRQSVYQAMLFSKLNWEEIAGRKVIIVDEKYKQFEPKGGKK